LLVDVVEDLLDHARLSYRCYDLQLAAALGTHFDVDLEDALLSFCPGKWREGIVGFSTDFECGLRFRVSPVLAFFSPPVGRGHCELCFDEVLTLRCTAQVRGNWRA